MSTKRNRLAFFIPEHGNAFDGRVNLLIVGVCLLLLGTFISARAQEPSYAAPPPFKLLSKSEKQQLSSETEIGDRTKLAIALMDIRLKSAEKSHANEDFQVMYADLGGFQALMDNTIEFLTRSGTHQGKVLNNLKKFEIALRTFSPRVESIRRELPGNFEPYVKNLLKYISQTREKAMEPFFSDTVTPRVRN
jgi:hypothetical protein